MKSICLIGFMGSGKTTVGEVVAKLLHKPWVDLDHYIVKQEDMSISQMFREYGEDYFRSLETKYLKEVLKNKENVISMGGGIITVPENVLLLQEQTVIYLDYPFETLYERIAEDKNRPLATSYEALKERYESRKQLYENTCQVKINCKGKSINRIVQEIISKLDRIS